MRFGISSKKKLADVDKVKNLSAWVKDKHGRLVAISRLLNCTPANITQLLNGNSGISHDKYMEIKKAAREVESSEH